MRHSKDTMNRRRHWVSWKSFQTARYWFSVYFSYMR